MALFAALFGAIVGSFLNALLFRFNTGRKVYQGRSRCMHCGHLLGPLDLIPIFSFLFLRGRCCYCHSRISLQYPLVEVTAALISAALFLEFSEQIQYVFWLVVWMTLLFVVVYDFRHMIIPWSASLTLIALAAGLLLYTYFFAPPVTTWTLLSGPILATPLLLLSLLSGGRWMGLGDAVLELSLGSFLGLSAGLTALMLAFWSGAVVGVVLLVLKYRVTMKTEIPFAPFLILGMAITFFLHVDFFSNLNILF